MSRGFIKIKPTSLLQPINVAVMAISKHDRILTFNKNIAQLCHHGLSDMPEGGAEYFVVIKAEQQ